MKKTLLEEVEQELLDEGILKPLADNPPKPANCKDCHQQIDELMCVYGDWICPECVSRMETEETVFGACTCGWCMPEAPGPGEERN